MTLMRRRKPRPLRHKFREAVWPTMGWRRTVWYYRHRLFRSGDSSTKVAAGFAVGVAMTFNPFLGTHVLQAVFLCLLLRFSAIAGFLGTVAGNPWTYPFIFWLIYKVGVTVCGWFGLAHFVAMPSDLQMTHFMDHPVFFFKYMLRHPQKLLLPLTVGGYLCGLAVWPLVYVLLLYPVHSIHAAYRLQRLRFHHRHRNRAQ